MVAETSSFLQGLGREAEIRICADLRRSAAGSPTTGDPDPERGRRGKNLHLKRSLVKKSGGEGGIRTPGTLSGTPVFKTGAINHSATSPGYIRATLGLQFGRTARKRRSCLSSSLHEPFSLCSSVPSVVNRSPKRKTRGDRVTAAAVRKPSNETPSPQQSATRSR